MSANAPSKAPSSQAKATYISSSGSLNSTIPVTARLTRALDGVYNFLGLYFVSLLTLDPYTAAQNSRFNTTGRRSAPVSGTRSAGTGAGAGAGGTTGWGGLYGSASGGSAGSGRRMGTVGDVRGPECGSGGCPS